MDERLQFAQPRSATTLIRDLGAWWPALTLASILLPAVWLLQYTSANPNLPTAILQQTSLTGLLSACATSLLSAAMGFLLALGMRLTWGTRSKLDTTITSVLLLLTCLYGAFQGGRLVVLGCVGLGLVLGKPKKPRPSRLPRKLRSTLTTAAALASGVCIIIGPTMFPPARVTVALTPVPGVDATRMTYSGSIVKVDDGKAWLLKDNQLFVLPGTVESIQYCPADAGHGLDGLFKDATC